MPALFQLRIVSRDIHRYVFILTLWDTLHYDWNETRWSLRYSVTVGVCTGESGRQTHSRVHDNKWHGMVRSLHLWIEKMSDHQRSLQYQYSLGVGMFYRRQAREDKRSHKSCTERRGGREEGWGLLSVEYHQ